MSWSPDDSTRHYMYEDVHAALSKLTWDDRVYKVLDFGSEWFGDPDGGWRTCMRTILKDVLGNSRIYHKLATYPLFNIEKLEHVPSDSYDILVADQVLEHVERPWVAASEILRVVSRGGLAFVATPGLYPIHPSPKDCWRIMPDGYKVLFPTTSWQWLRLGMWGSADRVGWEYLHNDAFPYGPPNTSVARAQTQPYFTAGHDARCPLMIWWLGRKRK